jgi:hypothetical protein
MIELIFVVLATNLRFYVGAKVLLRALNFGQT